MPRSTATYDAAPSARRRSARAGGQLLTPPADGTGLVVAPSEGSPRRALLLLLWLGLVHVNWYGREEAGYALLHTPAVKKVHAPAD